MLLTCPSLDINGWLMFHIIGIYAVLSSMVASMHCNSLPPQDNFLILFPVILSEFSCVTACGKEKNMVDMTQILNDILKAIFGKDVRQAIHDGIKRSNDIADDCDTRQTSLERQYDELLKNFSSTTPSAAEVVDARTGLDGTIYETLKKRLDDPRCS